MSFFGFDSSLPRDQSSSRGGSKGIFEQPNPFAGIQQARKLQALQDNEDEEILDFEDTYDGLGDQLQETGDDLNDDTFGGGLQGVAGHGNEGKDFDFFGNTAQYSDAIKEESVRYNLQPPTPVTHQPKRTGYEQYQDPGFIGEIESKSRAWSHKPQIPATISSQETEAEARGNAARGAASQPARKMMSLEEVEATLRQQPHLPPFPVQQEPYVHQQLHRQSDLPTLPSESRPHIPSTRPPVIPSPQHHIRVPSQGDHAHSHPPRQILQNPNKIRHISQPSQDRASIPQPRPGSVGPGGLPVITNPQQLMDLSEEQRKAYLEEDAKRAKRNHKIFLLSKGNGLMTPQDKNFITRIQLQQLVAATGNAADPNPEAALSEDFYYQVYSQIRGAPRQHPTQPLGHFAQTYLFQTGGRPGNNRRQAISGDNHMQRMQQQVQRAVEAAKAKPKNKQLIIEGSLGKISFSNAKTPKPLLNIKRHEGVEARPISGRKDMNQVSPSDRTSILKNIESVYSVLMKMEDHERKMPPSPPPQEGDVDAIQAHAEWRAALQHLNGMLWQDLKVLDPIVPGSTIIHPFIAFLAFAKGKKAIPRIFRLIDQEQRVTILTMIVVHLDQLDVIKDAKIAPGESQPPPAIREEIELFSQTIMPSLLSYVAEAPINIMIGLLGLLIEHTNLQLVAATKIGLNMMTMLLSRAELVKESGAVSDQDWQQWTTLYTRLFDFLEPMLGSIFPGPVNTGDDMYVWQFLAAVGIGASPEQQQRLVIGVKDRVMDTVTQSRTLPPEMSSQRLGNVNLFMRAIGLDVEMLG